MATKYQALLTRKKGIIIVGLIWSLASLLSLPPLIGWSTYQYHPGTYHCSPLWIGQCEYFYFTFTISVIIPSSLTVFSYSVIFWKVRKHRKRISSWKRGGLSAHGSKFNEGQETVSHIELSQMATTSPESKFVSRTLTDVNNPVISKMSLSPASIRNGNDKQYLVEPAGEKKMIEKNPHANEAWPNTIDTSPITVSKQHVTEDTSRGTKTTVQAHDMIAKEEGTSDENNTNLENNMEKSRAKSLMFKEYPVFYNPDSHTSSNKMQYKQNITVKEIEKVDSKKIDEAKIGIKETNAIHGGLRKPSKKNSASKEKKTSINFSNKDVKHFRLSEDDENELLNISDQGSKVDNDASTSLRDSTITDDVESLTTKEKINTAEEIVEEVKIDCVNENENKIRVIVNSVRSQNNTKKQSKKRGLRKSSRNTLREYQVAKKGAILLVLFMMCFGPYTIVHLCNLPYNPPLWAQHLAMWCVFLNSIFSPLIYGFTTKQSRKQVRDIFCKCFK
eukprot:gene17257-18982_t